MDIKSLHSKFHRNTETENISRGEKPSANPINKSGAEKSDGDRLSIGNVSFNGEMDMARAILQNLREQSFDHLRQIRTNIENGVYESDTMIAKIAGAMASEVSGIDAFVPSESTTNVETKPPVSLNAELRERLLNDSQVLDRISSRILDDISNL